MMKNALQTKKPKEWMPLSKEKLEEMGCIWEDARNAFTQGMGFEPRPGQLRMMELVENSLYLLAVDPSRPVAVLMIEGPTGTGKTFGYLVPCLPFVLENEKCKLVIVTANKTLQKQLFNKDLPAMQAMLPGCENLEVALPKGKGNFICLEKANMAMQEMMDVDDRAHFMQQEAAKNKKQSHHISKFRQSENSEDKAEWTDEDRKALPIHFHNLSKGKWSGDFDDLDIPDVVKNRWKINLAADRHSCNKKTCPSAKNCCYYREKSTWAEASVLIANMDWLLSSVKHGSRLVDPENTVFVFDEAHHLPDKAINTFKVEVELASLTKMMDISKLLASWNDLSLVEKQRLAPVHIQEIESLLKAAKDLLFSFAQEWHVAIEVFKTEFERQESFLNTPYKNGKEKKPVHSFLIPDESLYGSHVFRTALSDVLGIAHKVEHVFSLLQVLLETVKESPEWKSLMFDWEDARKDKDPKNKKSNDQKIKSKGVWFRWMGSVNRRLSDWGSSRQLFTQLLTPVSVEDSPIAKMAKKNKNGEWLFEISHTFADRILPEYIFNRAKMVILCSATLTSGQKKGSDGFDLFRQKIGLDGRTPGTVSSLEPIREALPSPFDFSRSIFVQTHLVNCPSGVSNFAWEREVIALLPKMVMDSGSKGTLILLTAQETLENWKKYLPRAFIPYCKFQKDGSTEALIERHKADVDAGKISVLIGLHSLAEGLDLPGKWCENVIIVKVPFTPPGDPARDLLRNWYEGNKRGNYFNDIATNEAATILHQQFGRLIRIMTDKGVISILDNRFTGESIAGKKPQSYQFHHVIPAGMKRCRMKAQDISEGGYKEIAKFLDGEEWDESIVLPLQHRL